MIALQEKQKCTGCTACAAACPTECISMKADQEGFPYPEICRERCIACGQCEAVCHGVRAPDPQEKSQPEVYGVKAHDLKLRMDSSSGGVFSLLAGEVLKCGGVVFGAAMTPDCRAVRHIMAEKQEELSMLQGSKYVQSDLDGIFRKVKGQLAHRLVLFSGTPCQVDGLKKYLGKAEKNLLCVEVICHGVPVPKLWERYVESVAGGKLVKKVNFRDKRHGWETFSLSMELDGTKRICRPLWKDPYLRMFLRNLCLRPSCHECPSKGESRSADLTIGDFWGIERVAPELNDENGTSMVLVHTIKGKQALETIMPQCQWKKVNYNAALEVNPAILHSAWKPAEREAFFADMHRLSFRNLAKKYVPLSGRERGVKLLQKLRLLSLVRHVYRIFRKR